MCSAKSSVTAMTFAEILNARSPTEGIDTCKVDVECGQYDILLSGSSTGLDRVRSLLMDMPGVDPPERHSPELIDSFFAGGFSAIGRPLTSDDFVVILFANSAIVGYQ